MEGLRSRVIAPEMTCSIEADNTAFRTHSNAAGAGNLSDHLNLRCLHIHGEKVTRRDTHHAISRRIGDGMHDWLAGYTLSQVIEHRSFEAPFLDQIIRQRLELGHENPASAARAVDTGQHLGFSATDGGAMCGSFYSLQVEHHAGNTMKHSDQDVGSLATRAAVDDPFRGRSEERRVGKECRSRWS